MLSITIHPDENRDPEEYLYGFPIRSGMTDELFNPSTLNPVFSSY
jgi:hypothetical protein